MIQSLSRLNSKQSLWQPVNIRLHQYFIWEDFKFSWNWMYSEWVADHMVSVFWITDDLRSDLCWVGDGERKERKMGVLWQHFSSNIHANKTNWTKLSRLRWSLYREEIKSFTKIKHTDSPTHTLRPKQDSLFTWRKTEIIMKAGENAHGLRRNCGAEYKTAP